MAQRFVQQLRRDLVLCGSRRMLGASLGRRAQHARARSEREGEVHRLDARPPLQVVRLHQAIRLTSDPVAKRKLAERALELAQEAEAIADLLLDVEALHASVAHYRHMLADAENISKQRILTHVLQRAEDKLEQMSRHQQPPKPHRLAVA